MRRISKKGAVELSIGTVVIIVLAMSMMILGIVLIKNIFEGSTTAVSALNKGVVNEINNLFSDKDLRIAFAPGTRRVNMEQGESEEGFAFSVRNKEKEEKRFTYTVEVDPNFDVRKKCGASFSKNDLNDWLVLDSGTINLGPEKVQEIPVLILFEIPESAPLCTIPFLVNVKDTGNTYVEGAVFLTIEAK